MQLSENIVKQFQPAVWMLVKAHTFRSKKFPQGFCTFMSSLCSVPDSSAVIESFFCIWLLLCKTLKQVEFRPGCETSGLKLSPIRSWREAVVD